MSWNGTLTQITSYYEDIKKTNLLRKYYIGYILQLVAFGGNTSIHVVIELLYEMDYKKTVQLRVVTALTRASASPPPPFGNQKPHLGLRPR